jgi:hypothetical protein
MQRVKITGQVFDFEQRSAVYHVQNAVKLSLSLKQGLKRVTILQAMLAKRCVFSVITVKKISVYYHFSVDKKLCNSCSCLCCNCLCLCFLKIVAFRSAVAIE